MLKAFMTASLVEPSVLLEKVSLTLAGPAGQVNILAEIDLSLRAGETLGWSDRRDPANRAS